MQIRKSPRARLHSDMLTMAGGGRGRLTKLACLRIAPGPVSMPPLSHIRYGNAAVLVSLETT